MNTQTISLTFRDPSAQTALATGWLPSSDRISHNLRKRVIARQVLGDWDGTRDRTILFEWITEASHVRPPGLAPWMQAVRAFSLTATGTPCLAVLAFAVGRGASLRIVTGTLALLGVLCLQIAINVFNDIEDYRRLIDLPGTLGGSGVIQKGWWTPSELRFIARFALGLGAVLGLPAIFAEPSLLVPMGAMTGLGVLLYSGKRYGLKYLALGDVAVWVLCGPALTLGFTLALSGTWSAGTLWIGAFFGFMATAILHVNNLQDMKLDRQRGVDTLAIRMGFRGSLRFLLILYIGAAASLMIGTARSELSVNSLSALIALGVGAPWMSSLFDALGPESARLADCRIKAAKIHLFSGSFLAVGLLIAAALGP